jgi:hypothetical protein
MVPVFIPVETIGGNKPHDFPAQTVFEGAAAVTEINEVQVIPFAASQSGCAFEGELCVNLLVFYIGFWKFAPAVVFGIANAGIGFDNDLVVGVYTNGISGFRPEGGDDQ